MKTPFYELAEKIGNNMEYNSWYLCNDLKIKFRPFIIEYFEPSVHEQVEYGHHDHTWATESQYLDYQNYRNHKGNQFRITALLFADLLWQDEMKGRKK